MTDKLNYENRLKKIMTWKRIAIFLLIMNFVAVLFTVVSLKQQLRAEKHAMDEPTGGLSHSIFDAQNNEYESCSGMARCGFGWNGHYAWDMYHGWRCASVENSQFFRNREQTSDVMGVTLISDREKEYGYEELREILVKDLHEAFGYDRIEEISREEGYYNGFNCCFIYMDLIKDKTATNVRSVTKGVMYLVECDEGFVIFTGFGESAPKDIARQCLKIFKSFRVTEEWIEKNEATTMPLFENETASLGEGETAEETTLDEFDQFVQEHSSDTPEEYKKTMEELKKKQGIESE